MEQQDLFVSVTIDQDFPGEASHCNTFAILLFGFDFSIKVTVKIFHVGILSSMWCKWKYANNVKYERWAFGAKISPGVLPAEKIMTLLTLFENKFFLNNSAAFWDF